MNYIVRIKLLDETEKIGRALKAYDPNVECWRYRCEKSNNVIIANDIMQISCLDDLIDMIKKTGFAYYEGTRTKPDGNKITFIYAIKTTTPSPNIGKYLERYQHLLEILDMMVDFNSSRKSQTYVARFDHLRNICKNNIQSWEESTAIPVNIDFSIKPWSYMKTDERGVLREYFEFLNLDIPIKTKHVDLEDVDYCIFNVVSRLEGKLQNCYDLRLSVLELFKKQFDITEVQKSLDRLGENYGIKRINKNNIQIQYIFDKKLYEEKAEERGDTRNLELMFNGGKANSVYQDVVKPPLEVIRQYPNRWLSITEIQRLKKGNPNHFNEMSDIEKELEEHVASGKITKSHNGLYKYSYPETDVSNLKIGDWVWIYEQSTEYLNDNHYRRPAIVIDLCMPDHSIMKIKGRDLCVYFNPRSICLDKDNLASVLHRPGALCPLYGIKIVNKLENLDEKSLGKDLIKNFVKLEQEVKDLRPITLEEDTETKWQSTFLDEVANEIKKILESKPLEWVSIDEIESQTPYNLMSIWSTLKIRFNIDQYGGWRYGIIRKDNSRCIKYDSTYLDLSKCEYDVLRIFQKNPNVIFGVARKSFSCYSLESQLPSYCFYSSKELLDAAISLASQVKYGIYYFDKEQFIYDKEQYIKFNKNTDQPFAIPLVITNTQWNIINCMYNLYKNKRYRTSEAYLAKKLSMDVSSVTIQLEKLQDTSVIIDYHSLIKDLPDKPTPDMKVSEYNSMIDRWIESKEEKNKPQWALSTEFLKFYHGTPVKYLCKRPRPSKEITFDGIWGKVA